MHTVKVFRTSRVEEFYNSNHSHTDGKFASGRGGTYAQRTPRPLTGRFAHMSDSQLARSNNPAHKTELEARKKSNTNVFLSAKTEEFFNHHHARSTGRFASGASGGLFGIAHTSKKMPKLFKSHIQTSSFLRRENRISPTMKNRKGMVFGTHTEEFYNTHHSKTDGKFTGGNGGVTPQQARQTVVNDLIKKSRDQSAKNLKQAGTYTPPPRLQHYHEMKLREARQAKLAQTNRARANYGMPPIKV